MTRRVSMRSKAARLALTGSFLLAVAAMTCVVLWWRHSQEHPSTDDAQLHAQYLWISPQVGGKVEEVFVQENQFVKRGDPLLQIDPEPYREAVAEAEAELAIAEEQAAAREQLALAASKIVVQQNENLAVAQKLYDTVLPLIERGSSDRVAVVQLTAAYLEARADAADALLKLTTDKDQVENSPATIRKAKAALALARMRLAWTRITSPSDGYVSQFTLAPGAVVQPDSQLFSIVETSNWWVTANFREGDLDRIAPGQPAEITIDMYPGRKFTGKVESLSIGSTSFFSILPAQSTSASFVKVAQRVPVRVSLEEPEPGLPLRVGTSASVRVDTRGANAHSLPAKDRRAASISEGAPGGS